MKKIADTILASSENIIGPILFDYVCWTLHEAHKRKIQRLYFLARDGYILYEIAQRIAREHDIPIECRYLYCSRTALRLPSYHLIGEEALDLLFLGGYNLSRHNILERISIDFDERVKIYKEMGYSLEGENELLNYEDFYTYTNKLRSNKRYRDNVVQKSKSAYPAAIGYLKQEGLLDINHIAIVDSGWTGTMQRTLRQLLSSVSYQGRITGFYFGIYKFLKKDAQDGEFCSWYFGEKSCVLNRLLFSNSLFECFLSAPHGMTLTYEYSNNRYSPKLKPPPDKEMLFLIESQQKGILEYTAKKLKTFILSDFSYKYSRKHTEHLLRRFMTQPSKEEAEAYGKFAFCDDIAEQELNFLVSETQKSLLKENYLIYTRIYRKLTGLSKTYVYRELFWPYGTAALLEHKYIIQWYRLNIFMLECLRWKLLKKY